MQHAEFNDEIELGNGNQIKQTEAYLGQDLETAARLSFIRKVYSILTMQLAVTVGFCTLAYNIESFLQFQIENQWLLWVSCAFLLVTELLIMCTNMGKIYPYNMILLLGFTLCESYAVSFTCSTYARQEGGEIVLIAAAMTLGKKFFNSGIFAALTIYACKTERDFTVSRGIMLVIMTTSILFGFICMISRSPFLNTLYCALGVIMFGIYIIIDTQMIISNKKFGITMDDYVLGALILYIDLIQLFLHILRLLSQRK